jgi:hypothetical protein
MASQAAAAAAGPSSQASHQPAQGQQHQPAQGQVMLSPMRQAAAARTWADTLDDDDEIVYYSSAADDMAGMAFDVKDITEDVDQAMQVRAGLVDMPDARHVVVCSTCTAALLLLISP